MDTLVYILVEQTHIYGAPLDNKFIDVFSSAKSAQVERDRLQSLLEKNTFGQDSFYVYVVLCRKLKS